jgi:hypothetical protein
MKKKYFRLSIMHINIFDMHLVKQIDVFDQVNNSSDEKKENLWLEKDEIEIEDIDEQYLINDYLDVCVRLSLNKHNLQ